MLTSISPLGERARASRWWLTTTAYVVSSLVGGLALGLVAALLGSLVPAAWRSSPAAYLLVAVALLVGLLLDSGVAGRRLPTWRRQVDRTWLDRYRGWVVGVGFGTQLGSAWSPSSPVPPPTPSRCSARSPGPGGGLWSGTFGLVRALPSAFVGRVDHRSSCWRLLARVQHGAPTADRAAEAARSQQRPHCRDRREGIG